MFFHIFLPFFMQDCKVSKFQRDAGKHADLMALLKLVHKHFVNMSIFFIMILVRISVFCKDLVLPDLTIFFFDFPYVYFVEMKYFVFAVLLNCKNARVIFYISNGFEN